jgi:neutral ceramidase
MLTAGAARVEITPPLTIPYLGYVPRHAFFEGVHDPLFARAVVVDDGERRIAVLAADSIGFSRRLLGAERDFVGELRERVRQLTGIPPEALLLSATHAHSTPETLGLRPLREHPGALSWVETLRDQLASAVALADRARVPARLKRGSILVEGVARCRRILGKDGRVYNTFEGRPAVEVASWGVTDRELVVLLLERPDGRPGIVLTHFACHPVTVQVQPQVSADFPGVMTAVVERAAPGWRSPCLFLQGAAGSINPMRDTTGFEDVARYGLTLAGATLQLLGQMAAPGYPVEAERVGAARTMVQLPSRPIPPLAPLEAAVAEARARRDAAAIHLGGGHHERSEGSRGRAGRGADGDPPPNQAAEERNRLAGAVLWAEEAVLRARMGDAPLAAEVQALRLGDTALVGIPGEPFCEMGLAMKAWEPPLRALCLGYANDMLGYMAPPSAWEEGGYEVGLGTWTLAGPEAFGLLLKTAQRLVRELA